MTTTLRICFVAALALTLAGCGIIFPTSRERAGKETPGFKAGYSDGCASATIQGTNYRSDVVRDENAYKNDKHYRAGWSSGFQSCRTNLTHDTTLPSSTGPILDPLPGAQRH